MIWPGPHELAILLTIIVINITLSGDNAVAMAASGGSSLLRRRIGAAMISVTLVGAAQIVAAATIIRLLALPVVGLVGAAFLVYRAISLMLAEPPASQPVPESDGKAGFCRMVAKVTLANLITSGDNIVAVAAVSEGREDLVAIGLMVCLPVIVFGSMTIIYFLTRYPVILLVVAGRLGYVAGGMGVQDPLWEHWLAVRAHPSVYSASMLLAGALVAIGAWCMFVRRPAPILARDGTSLDNNKHRRDME